MPTPNQQKPYPLRIPPDLMDWVRGQAAINARSLNKEIEYRLQRVREESQQGAARGVRQP